METAHQLDYQKKIRVHPNYRQSRVLPLTGSQQQIISTTGGQENIFEIPVNAVNFSRSYINFRVNVPPGPDPGYNNVFLDTVSMFQQIQLYTRSGIYLCDLQYANNYTKIVMNAETKLSEFLDYDVQSSVNNVNITANSYASSQIGEGALFFRNNSNLPQALWVQTVAGPPPVLALQTSNYATLRLNAPVAYAAGPPIVLAVSNTASINYTEPAYFMQSILEAGGDESRMNFNCKIDLGKFKNTILSLDKDLYFGEILILRFVWAPSVKVIFENTSPSNLSTGAAASVNPLNISNLELILDIEKDQNIVNQLRSQVSSSEGMKVLIPYIYSYKTSLTGGTQGVSLRFNRGHGARLKKIYHAVFNGTESANTAYDHDNRFGSKVATYYTMLNNERLQEFDLNVAALHDWQYHKDQLKGSVIQNYDIYQYNWFHRDQFDGEYSINDDLANYVSGLDLNSEQKWDIYMTINAAQVANAMNNYSFAITEKMLTVSPSGITVL